MLWRLFWSYKAGQRYFGRFKGTLSVKHRLGLGSWMQCKGKLQKDTGDAASGKAGLCQDSFLLLLSQVRLR